MVQRGKTFLASLRFAVNSEQHQKPGRRTLRGRFSVTFNMAVVVKRSSTTHTHTQTQTTKSPLRGTAPCHN